MDCSSKHGERVNGGGDMTTHLCEECRRETTHRTLGLHPHPRDATKTVRLLECVECRATVAVEGPAPN